MSRTIRYEKSQRQKVEEWEHDKKSPKRCKINSYNRSKLVNSWRHSLEDEL